jgi:hypothetical protein
MKGEPSSSSLVRFTTHRCYPASLHPAAQSIPCGSDLRHRQNRASCDTRLPSPFGPGPRASRLELVSNSSKLEVNECIKLVKTKYKKILNKNKENRFQSPLFLIKLSKYFIFLNTLLPFEPTLFPKLQVYFADFPYLRYTTSPEAINLEDLMRLLVRHGLKIIFIFFPQHIIFQGTKAIHSYWKK